MLLRGVQPQQRRERMEVLDEGVEVLRPQFGAMAESESKLRKILNSLDRNPSGMLSDFDMHTKISSSPVPPRPPCIHDEDDEDNDDGPCMCDWIDSHRVSTLDGASPLVDFRTGSFWIRSRFDRQC